VNELSQPTGGALGSNVLVAKNALAYVTARPDDGGKEVLLASTWRLGGELTLGDQTAAQRPTNGH